MPSPLRIAGRVKRAPAAAWLLGAALLLTWSLAFQGSRPLWDQDEGRYTAVAMEMLGRGDYVVPVLHHEQPHVTKPPLTYWAIAGCVSLLGRNEWAVRLPNALAFAATGMLLYSIGKRLVPRRPWLPAAVHALTALPFAAEGIVTTDTLLAAWETAAMACYVAALYEPRPRWRRAWIAGLWLGLGLAFLTKGPPGLLPLAAIASFTVLGRRSIEVPRLSSLVGAVCFSLVAFGWFFAAERRLPGLLEHLVGYEVVDRVATDAHHRNGHWTGVFVAYGPVFVLGTLPWTPLCVGALRGFRAWFRPSSWRAACARDPATGLLLCWLVVPLVVFLVARSRLPLYVLPLFAPLALLIARRLDARAALASRGRVAALAAWAVLLLALKLASAHVSAHGDARDYARFVSSVADVPFREIEFVDMHRHYGLAFYLDVEIESVALSEHQAWEGGFGRRESLSESLAEDEQRLFVVHEAKGAFFEDECRRLGARAHFLGERHDERIYSVVAPPRPDPQAAATSRA